MAPMASWPAWIGILLWSIPVSVFALWIFKRFSNQDRIAAVKAKIHACLFEIRLFNDDIRAIFRAQWEITGHVLHYQALALKPMIWILPPLVLIMVQLHAFYGFRGLKPGESALVTAAVASTDSAARPDLALEVPDGVSLETPGVWAADLGEMAWRVRADEPGRPRTRIHHQRYRSRQESAGDRPHDAPLSGAAGELLLGPVGVAVRSSAAQDAGLTAITLSYPEATVDFLVFEMESQWAWMILFFVLTMVIALALKKPMGVEL